MGKVGRDQVIEVAEFDGGHGGSEVANTFPVNGRLTRENERNTGMGDARQTRCSYENGERWSREAGKEEKT